MIRIISFVVKQTAQPSIRFRACKTATVATVFLVIRTRRLCYGVDLRTGYRPLPSLAAGRATAVRVLYVWVLFHKVSGNFSQQ